MRHIDYSPHTREATCLDVRPRRLYEVLVKVGLMPDEPFVGLSSAVERALERAVDKLFADGDEMACMTTEDKVHHFESRAFEARMQLEREEQRKEAAAAVRKAEVAFSEATAP